MIIALSGAAGAGKSTGAAYLAHAYGFERIRFAGPLKAMLRAFLETAGTPPEQVERMIEGDLKEVPCWVLGGQSPRYAMQHLGHDWGRVMMAPGLWTTAWENAAAAALSRGAPGVVVEDVRYENEAASVRSLGGTVVQIKRAGPQLDVGSHATEQQPVRADVSVWNDGPTEILHARLDGLVDRYRSHAA